jgi:hypothetical protein
MTSSFTAMMLAASLVFQRRERCGRCGQHRSGRAEASRATQCHAARLAAESYSRVVYLGSNGFKALAREAALKLLELTDGKVVAAYDSPLGFRHGPKTIVTRDTLLFVFVSNDPYTRRYDLDLLRELRADALAGRVIAITAQADDAVGSGRVPARAASAEAPPTGICIFRTSSAASSMPFIAIAVRGQHARSTEQFRHGQPRGTRRDHSYPVTGPPPCISASTAAAPRRPWCSSIPRRHQGDAPGAGFLLPEHRPGCARHIARRRPSSRFGQGGVRIEGGFCLFRPARLWRGHRSDRHLSRLPQRCLAAGRYSVRQRHDLRLGRFAALPRWNQHRRGHGLHLLRRAQRRHLPAAAAGANCSATKAPHTGSPAAA